MEHRLEASVGKTPYVRFDLNDYSVPHDRVRRTLVVRATQTQVRVLDAGEVVAVHARSFGRGKQIEDPEHVAALVVQKRQARRERGQDRLAQAVPRSGELLVALAERGGRIGSSVGQLLRLLDRYGTEELSLAVDEALQTGAPSAQTVRLVLERRRREQGAPPPLPVALPDDERVTGVVVRPHALGQYDPEEVRDERS